MLANLVQSTSGAIHLAATLVAMLSRSIILLIPKGHKRIDYIYVVAMFTLNVTAFMIYNLFGKFGPFHAAAIFSTITIWGV